MYKVLISVLLLRSLVAEQVYRNPHDMFGYDEGSEKSSDHKKDVAVDDVNSAVTQRNTEADEDSCLKQSDCSRIEQQLSECKEELNRLKEAGAEMGVDQEPLVFHVRRFLFKLHRALPSASNAVEGVYLLQVNVSSHERLRLQSIADRDAMPDISELSTVTAELFGWLGPGYVADEDDVYLTNPWLRRIRHELPTIFYSTAIVILCLVGGRIFLRMLKSISLLGAVVIFLSSAFFISVFISYVYLYQEAVAQRLQHMEKGMPEECRARYDPGILAMIGSWFSLRLTDTCQEYFRSAHIDPFVKVDIFQAVTHTVTKGLVQPAGLVGKAINIFFRYSLDGLPFYLQIVVLAFFIIFLLTWHRYRFSSWIFNIEPGNAEALMLKEKIKDLEAKVKTLKEEKRLALASAEAAEQRSVLRIQDGGGDIRRQISTPILQDGGGDIRRQISTPILQDGGGDRRRQLILPPHERSLTSRDATDGLVPSASPVAGARLETPATEDIDLDAEAPNESDCDVEPIQNSETRPKTKFHESEEAQELHITTETGAEHLDALSLVLSPNTTRDSENAEGILPDIS